MATVMSRKKSAGTFDSLEMMRSFYRTRMPARQRERSCALSLLASRLGDMRSDIYFGFSICYPLLLQYTYPDAPNPVALMHVVLCRET
jgi:hypothetical protein